jgi:hypothetical protein
VRLSGEDLISKLRQRVVCNGFRLGIDTIGSADAQDCKKPRNVGFDEHQRACRALFAGARQSGDLFKPCQQCDVSVHENIPSALFPKRELKIPRCVEANDQCGGRHWVSKVFVSSPDP